MAMALLREYRPHQNHLTQPKRHRMLQMLQRAGAVQQAVTDHLVVAVDWLHPSPHSILTLGLYTLLFGNGTAWQYGWLAALPCVGGDWHGQCCIMEGHYDVACLAATSQRVQSSAHRSGRHTLVTMLLPHRMMQVPGV